MGKQFSQMSLSILIVLNSVSIVIDFLVVITIRNKLNLVSAYLCKTINTAD